MKFNKETAFFLAAIALTAGCNNQEMGCNSSEHGEDAAPEQAKGPHGGKLFQTGDFAIEVTIYEPEIPPQSHVYAYEKGKLVDPSEVNLVTELHRIDRVDTLYYVKQDDFLNGDKVVEEPHSFDVKLSATYKGKNYAWAYSSYEGRTTLSGEAIRSTGIEIEKASGTKISTSLTLNGRVVPDNFKVTTLNARFAGVVKELRKPQGARVEKGEVIATIESNESLKSYDVVSPRAGEVLDIATAVGEVVGSTDAILTVGDLSSVWVELSVPKKEFLTLKIGQKVLVNLTPEKSNGLEGKLIYLSSIADEDTQTRLGRAEFINTDHALIPEMFVETKVVVEEREVPVAIKAEALQKFRDWDVVFKKFGNNFEIAILKLGEADGDWIEVKDGLLPGTEYVTKNSFVVKADVMKSGATHDH